MNIPIFPLTEKDYINHYLTNEGMTLRDYFAGQVLSGLYAMTNDKCKIKEKEIADYCYYIADLMTSARDKGEDNE